MPAVKEAAEPGRIPGLLDQKVDLALNRQGAVLLHPVEFLTDPEEGPLGHGVVVLLAAGLALPLLGLGWIRLVAILQFVGL